MHNVIADPDLPSGAYGNQCAEAEMFGISFNLLECPDGSGLFYRLKCEGFELDINPERIEITNANTRFVVSKTKATAESGDSLLEVSNQGVKVTNRGSEVNVRGGSIKASNGATSVTITPSKVSMKGVVEIDGSLILNGIVMEDHYHPYTVGQPNSGGPAS